MKVLRRLEEVRLRRRAISIGVFDGVHRGHMRILETLRAVRKDEDLESGLLLSFHPHPLALLRPESPPRMICTLDERIALLAELGIDELLVLDFTPEIAATVFDAFAREVLVGCLGMKHLVAGYDFRMGRGRGGSAVDMAALGEREGFRVDVVTPYYLDGEIISSTRIRAAVEAADMEAARVRLGRPFSLSGRVVSGKGLGRELGFPTANLESFPAEKLLPPSGVYRVKVRKDGRSYDGLMNLGNAPTLRDRFMAELHLLDFQGDLYGASLKVDVIQWLRGEEKFHGFEDLHDAIAADVSELLSILEKEDRESR